MRSSTKRILSILLSGIFLIGLIVVSTSLIKPTLGTIMEKRAELFSKRQLFQNQSNAVNQVQTLLDQFKGFDQLQNTISLAMPTNRNTTQVLAQLNAIARNSNARVTSFESSPEGFESTDKPLTKRLGVTEVTVGVAGNYSGISNFVELLESNVRIFNVTELTIDTLRVEGQNQPRVEGEITFNTYFQES